MTHPWQERQNVTRHRHCLSSMLCSGVFLNSRFLGLIELSVHGFSCTKLSIVVGTCLSVFILSFKIARQEAFSFCLSQCLACIQENLVPNQRGYCLKKKKIWEKMCSLDHWNPINIFLYFLVLFIHSASIYFMPLLGHTPYILGEKQVEFLLSPSLLSTRILDLQQITTPMKTMSVCVECYEGKWLVLTVRMT